MVSSPRSTERTRSSIRRTTRCRRSLSTWTRGSYTISRRWIESGEVPDPALVRVEEFVNFFDQDYAPPRNATFAVYADGAPTPFTTSSRNLIVRIGIKARDVHRVRSPGCGVDLRD